MPLDDRALIDANARIHNRICRSYESKQGGIYNEVEQRRLREKLQQAIASIRTDVASVTALDYGCGPGNVTKHLLELGAEVSAADVSQGFLDLVVERYGASGKVRTLLLNGEDLSGVDDAAYHLVAIYAVLHHIPDYLRALSEAIRVLRPGGVLFVHETCDSYWRNDRVYREFKNRVRPYVKPWRTRFLSPAKWWHGLRKLVNPSLGFEGDVHCTANDHIEWAKIDDLVRLRGCEVVASEDYLVYRPGYPLKLYDEYRARCADAHELIARR